MRPNQKVLITQPKNAALEATYGEIIADHKASIDFYGFLEHQPIPVPLFRKYKPDINQYGAIVFTNRTAIDNFFQLSKACSIKIEDNKKYFCLTDILQNYLRKYINFKKRKVFHGKRKLEDLFPFFVKNRQESFLLPSSGIKHPKLFRFFEDRDITYKEIVIYKTRTSKLDTLDPYIYDIIVFFTPLAVNAFIENFPNYTPKERKIIAFGQPTVNRLDELGWDNIIQVPTPTYPSIISALSAYLEKKEG